MTKNKAIELAYIEIIKHKFDEDAVQHCFEFMLNKTDEFIIELQANNKLVNYILKKIYCTIKGINTDFQKDKIKESLLEDLPEHEDLPYNPEVNLNNIYWFDKEVLILYSEHDCNLSKVSKKTLIPIDSIRRAVTRAVKKFKENEEIRQRIFRR